MNRLWGKIGIIIALALVVIPAMGASCSVTTAAISEATMAPEVNAEAQPVNATDVFATDTPEIFCSFKLSHAPDDTHLKAEWIYIQGEVEGLTDYLLATWETTTDGTRYVETSLTPPDTGWPRGEYQVVLYIDDEAQTSVPFTIE